MEQILVFTVKQNCVSFCNVISRYFHVVYLFSELFVVVYIVSFVFPLFTPKYNSFVYIVLLCLIRTIKEEWSLHVTVSSRQVKIIILSFINGVFYFFLATWTTPQHRVWFESVWDDFSYRGFHFLLQKTRICISQWRPAVSSIVTLHTSRIPNLSGTSFEWAN